MRTTTITADTRQVHAGEVEKIIPHNIYVYVSEMFLCIREHTLEACGTLGENSIERNRSSKQSVEQHEPRGADMRPH